MAVQKANTKKTGSWDLPLKIIKTGIVFLRGNISVITYSFSLSLKYPQFIVLTLLFYCLI